MSDGTVGIESGVADIADAPAIRGALVRDAAIHRKLLDDAKATAANEARVCRAEAASLRARAEEMDVVAAEYERIAADAHVVPLQQRRAGNG